MSQHVKLFLNTFLLSIVLFSLISCGSDIDKIPKTEFSQIEFTEWKAPFDGIWVAPNAPRKISPNQTVYLAPVITQFVDENLDDNDKESFDKIAEHYHDELYKNLSNKVEGKFTLVDSPKKASITIKTAIVKMTPTKNWVNIATAGVSLYVPLINTITGYFTTGDAAMIAKVIDNKTGKVFAEFGDYRKDEPSIFGSFQDFTRWGHHYSTVEMWADKMAETLCTDEYETVRPPFWFTIKPW